MNRRKFNYFFSVGLIGLFSSVLLSNCKSNKFKIVINNEQKKLIQKYNDLRKRKLENNFSDEVKKDLLKNKTLWIGHNIYTYAELSKI